MSSIFPLHPGDIIHPPGADWNTFLVLDAIPGSVKLLQCIGVRSEVSEGLLTGWQVKRRAEDLRRDLERSENR